MKDHESVTVTHTCQLGVTAGKRSVSEVEAVATCAQRLEDVEKFVRNHDREIEAILAYVEELEERLRRAGEIYSLAARSM